VSCIFSQIVAGRSPASIIGQDERVIVALFVGQSIGMALATQMAFGVRPNKRLMLPGGDGLKGNGVFVPWRARTVVQRPCAGERVARSLSAVR
jgi:hypothetical protein